MLKSFFAILIILSSFILVNSKTNAETNKINPSGCLKNFDQNRDYFPNKVVMKYSKRVSISYHGYYKVIKLNNPWPNSKINFEFILMQCGSKTPPSFKNLPVIKIPVNNVAALSTTQIAFLDKLGLADKITGISKTSWVNSKTVIENYKRGNVAQLGMGTDLNLEKLLQIKPEIIFLDGVDNSVISAIKNIKRTKVKTVIVSDYMEESPLGRSEWIKFFSAFFNLEKKANKFFLPIEKQYLELEKIITKTSYKPTVLTGAEYDGLWFLPGGKSFMATFIKDAGAKYIFDDNLNLASVNLSFEWIYSKANNADFWINTDNWQNLNDAIKADKRHRLFKAFKNKNIFNNNAKLNPFAGNDFWESAIISPHLILKDLIKIFHPKTLKNHELVWYHQLK